MFFVVILDEFFQKGKDASIKCNPLLREVDVYSFLVSTLEITVVTTKNSENIFRVL
jgi:hypothetical protein